MAHAFSSHLDPDDYHPCTLWEAIQAFRMAVEHGAKCPCGEMLPERYYPPVALKWYEAHKAHFEAKAGG